MIRTPRTPPSETETTTGTGTGELDIDELRRTLAHQQQVIQQLQQSQSSRPPSSGMAVINEGTLGTNIPSPPAGMIPGQTVAMANPLQVDVFYPGRQPLGRWLQRLEGTFKVFQIREEADRVAYLLHFVGVEIFGILCDRLDPVDPYTQRYGTLVEKLKEFYEPELLEIAEIYIYRKRMQGPQESERRIQARLLETVNLTKESALKIACGMEMAEKGVNKLKEESPTEATVDFIGVKSKQKKTKGCGQAHFTTNCTLPRTVKCRECGGFEHLQKVCKKKGQAHMLEEVCSVMDREHLEHRAKFTVPLQIENRNVVFDIDCGSAVILVSEKWVKNTFPKLPLYKTNLKLRSYCKQNFVPSGFVTVKVKDVDQTKTLNMYEVKYDRDPLLGREWINQLEILAKVKNSLVEVEDIKMLDTCNNKKLDELLEKYKNVLSEDFAHIKNFEAHLKLKPDARPVFMKNRAVPFKILEKVGKELDRMVEAGILEKVESSKWATPIMPVLKKDGLIRICGDFSVTVNPALIVDDHSLSTTDELFASMSENTIFSKIDLKQAYLQLRRA
ncbi:uncharacterized protein LOC112466501 [Temnothorax curvispinosus]|uniref:Uncharacterized protein LOC112466501 n=1 Tax=Temnothorax curvispinosus TaxID=300111 RepID=A0A6J1R851_9HYME|nr:uncharacterized protein LOC112466501 [Temnothorax curvispinosus]